MELSQKEWSHFLLFSDFIYKSLIATKNPLDWCLSSLLPVTMMTMISFLFGFFFVLVVVTFVILMKIVVDVAAAAAAVEVESCNGTFSNNNNDITSKTKQNRRAVTFVLLNRVLSLLIQTLTTTTRKEMMAIAINNNYARHLIGYPNEAKTYYKNQKGNGNTKSGSLPKISQPPTLNSSDIVACDGIIHEFNHLMYLVYLSQLRHDKK